LTPDLIGDAIRHYSEWFITHQAQELTRFRNHLSVKEGNFINFREHTNYICWATAFQSFLCSLQDLEFSSDVCQQLQQRLEFAIADAHQAHEELTQKLKENIPLGNISYCLLNGYHMGAFNLAKKIKKLPVHGGIIWKGDLCLRGDDLEQSIRTQPGYHNWTQSKISRALKDINVLVIQEDNANTVKLDSQSPRVYRIRLNVLEDTAERY
jgi:hypothetical protein